MTSTKRDPAGSLLLLPNELKEEILMNLEPDDLLSLMQSCKTFNAYVEDNSKLMEKLTLRISKMSKTKAISHRKYQRIFVDCDPSWETISSQLLNMAAEDIKVIIFNQGTQQYSLIGACAPYLVSKFKNLNTINMIRVNGTKLRPEYKRQSAIKTMNIWQNASPLNCDGDCEVVNVHDIQFGLSNWKFAEMKLLKSLSLSGDISFCREYGVTITHNYNLQEITFKDCRMEWMPQLNLPSLRSLKLINITFHESFHRQTLDFLSDRSKIDELHIENCEKLLWCQDVDNHTKKVKHLKLINMKYPHCYGKAIHQNRRKVESLTMSGITFTEKEKDFLLVPSKLPKNLILVLADGEKKKVKLSINSVTSLRKLLMDMGIDTKNKVIK